MDFGAILESFRDFNLTYFGLANFIYCIIGWHIGAWWASSSTTVTETLVGAYFCSIVVGLVKVGILGLPL